MNDSINETKRTGNKIVRRGIRYFWTINSGSPSVDKLRIIGLINLRYQCRKQRSQHLNTPGEDGLWF